MDESVYAVGDLQGCLESLKGLLSQLPDDSRLVFLGDIVNRGPDSLGTLRFVKRLCESGRADCVLGNHDLHLLAVASGNGCEHRRDTIGPILSAPDRDDLIEWLRRQKLAIFDQGTLFVHAGVHETWDLDETLSLASEAQAHLSGDDWQSYLDGMYGNTQWREGLEGAERMRAILNVLTRQRFVRETGSLDFDAKVSPARAPRGLVPWFERPGRKLSDQLIVIGHWSVLGLMVRGSVIAVDTGCLWGGSLTAVRLPDRKIFSEQCPPWCGKTGGAA